MTDLCTGSVTFWIRIVASEYFVLLNILGDRLVNITWKLLEGKGPQIVPGYIAYDLFRTTLLNRYLHYVRSRSIPSNVVSHTGREGVLTADAAPKAGLEPKADLEPEVDEAPKRDVGPEAGVVPKRGVVPEAGVLPKRLLGAG